MCVSGKQFQFLDLHPIKILYKVYRILKILFMFEIMYFLDQIFEAETKLLIKPEIIFNNICFL